MSVMRLLVDYGVCGVGGDINEKPICADFASVRGPYLGSGYLDTSCQRVKDSLALFA